MTPRFAPEAKSDLEALRELANLNARRAINRSDVRRNSSALLFKVSVALLGMACSASLLYLNGLRLNAPFLGMLCALVVAVLWGIDSAVQFKRLSGHKLTRTNHAAQDALEFKAHSQAALDLSQGTTSSTNGG
jgi:hypothetical protein